MLRLPSFIYDYLRVESHDLFWLGCRVIIHPVVVRVLTNGHPLIDVD